MLRWRVTCVVVACVDWPSDVGELSQCTGQYCIVVNQHTGHADSTLEQDSHGHALETNACEDVLQRTGHGVGPISDGTYCEHASGASDTRADGHQSRQDVC